MKILAYDTSSNLLSIALFDGERKLAEYKSPLFTRHSSVLAPTIGALLKRSRCEVHSLEYIAVGLGPGSFTGLRVGITTAKTLAYVTGARVVGVPSLEIIAFSSNGLGQKIGVMLDAKKGKVYAALYKKITPRTLETIQVPMLTQEGDFLKRAGRSAVIIKENIFPNASDLAILAMQRIKEKKFIDPFKLEPLYLHPRDCNVTKKKKDS